MPMIDSPIGDYPDHLQEQVDILKQMLADYNEPCCDDPGCRDHRLALAFRDMADAFRNNAVLFHKAAVTKRNDKRRKAQFN